MAFTIAQAACGKYRAHNVISLTGSAHPLLSVTGEIKAVRACAVVEAIEQQGTDPCEVDPQYWRRLHACIAMYVTPRMYTRDVHTEYLRGRPAR
jgi:Protein of unknown function (DUF2840)